MDQGNVAVIVATYNGRQYLPAALASVATQSQPPAELIVVDAGSTDGTTDLLTSITSDFPAVRVIAAPQRCTAPQARNLALSATDATYIATLDQDDLMAPDRLSQQLAVLTAEPAFTAVGGRLRRIDANGAPIPRAHNSRRFQQGWPTNRERIRWTLPTFSPTVTSALMYRRAALVAAGGFDEAHPLTDDYALTARLASEDALTILDCDVGSYRWHNDMTSLRHHRRQLFETRMLQWRLIHERLRTQPDLGTIDAMIRPAQGWSARQLRTALDLLHALFAEATTRPNLDAEDHTWIEGDFARGCEQIETALLSSIRR